MSKHFHNMLGVVARKRANVGGYLIEESFEETGIPSSGLFAVALGSVNWDATPSPASPDGGQSFSTPDRNNNVSITDNGLETYFQIMVSSLGFAGTDIIVLSGASNYADITINDSGAIVIKTNGTIRATMVNTYSANTWYHVKTVIDPGVKFSVEFSTDGVFSGSGDFYAETTTNVPTSPLSATKVIKGRRSSTMYIDRYISSSSPIPNNP